MSSVPAGPRNPAEYPDADNTDCAEWGLDLGKGIADRILCMFLKKEVTPWLEMESHQWRIQELDHSNFCSGGST